MNNYSKFISSKRRSVSTPDNLVESGIAHLGTFDKEFKNLNLLDIPNPTKAPDALQKARLSVWEALEVHFNEGYFLCALVDKGFFRMILHVFFNFATKETTYWTSLLSSSDLSFGTNLISGSKASGAVKKANIEFINELDKGVAKVSGKHKNKKYGFLKYSFDLTKIAEPSIVSIPFGENRPLYTEKMFFKVKGELVINDKVYLANEGTTGIIDDHRGYYPRSSHYDWMSTMGRLNGKFVSFNLTRNQSIDPYNYNENLIMEESGNNLLPPVHFDKSGNSIDFISEEKTPIIWHIHDDHGMVDLTFKMQGVYRNCINILVFKSRYFIVFGRISGYLLREDGSKVEYNDYPVIGEDKTLIL